MLLFYMYLHRLSFWKKKKCQHLIVLKRGDYVLQGVMSHLNYWYWRLTVNESAWFKKMLPTRFDRVARNDFFNDTLWKWQTHKGSFSSLWKLVSQKKKKEATLCHRWTNFHSLFCFYYLRCSKKVLSKMQCHELLTSFLFQSGNVYD